jgi:hypothetical protein
MNQRFGLLPTPALARRLMLFARFDKIVLSDEIAVLATQDCVGEEYFDPLLCPRNAARQEVTQFIVDCDFRCIIKKRYAPWVDELTVLNALRHNKMPITMVVDRSGEWMQAARLLNMTQRLTWASKRQHLAKIPPDTLRQSILLLHMDRPVALALASNFDRLRMAMRLCPAVILYAAADHPTPTQSDMFDALFPTMPPFTQTPCTPHHHMYYNVFVPHTFDNHGIM